MIVLHISVCDEQLFLWGESPPRDRKADTSPNLPYASSAKMLISAATEGGLRLSEKSGVHLHVWLPTWDGTPLPSSPLIADPPAVEAEPVLAPWGITAIVLSTEEAFHFLATCYGKKMLAPGVILGSDVRYFARLLRFTSTLITREQFLPGVLERDGELNAVWEPVFLGDDVDKLTALAGAMPQSCRALTNQVETAPGEASVEIITKITKAFLDYLVRLSWIERRQANSRSRKSSKTTFASVHDQWLYALRSWNPAMSGDRETLEYLAGQIKAWRRSVSVSASAPFRLSFRLEEPENDDAKEQWYVRYLLNAADDPSLFIEVADAWNPGKQTKSIFAKRQANIQEYLLTSLGHVSSLHLVLEESLKKTRPGGATLDTEGAYTFLTETAWLLQQAGYKVQLPAWWSSTGTRKKLSVRTSVASPTMKSKGNFSLDDIIEFDWRVALGDDKLSLADLETLAKMKIPLVKIRGQWVQIDAKGLQEAIDFWKKKSGDQVITARDVVHMALGLSETPESLPLNDMAATGWVGDLLRSLENEAEVEDVPVPDQFVGTLRPYQSRGYAWLAFLQRWGLGACLADDMGLGKTPQTLVFIQHSRETNDERPVLVVCPTSVIGNWQKEAAHFTPNLSVLVHHGPRRVRDPESFQEETLKQAIVITGFPLLYRDFEALSQVNWAAVILDEAQNIKNSTTKQAKAAQALKADFRVALTGTPVENNVGELWSIMEFLNPGFLDSQAKFKRRFFVPIQVDRDVEAIKLLKQITGPFILRRLKTDKTIIDDLPEKQETNVFTTLTKEQGSLYRAVVKDISQSLESAEDIQRKGLILATLMKLKQICNHPAQFLHDDSAIPDRSGKLTRLTEMLEEVYEVGDRVLIFTQFTEMGRILQQHLQETFGREALFLHGGVPKKQRDRMVERFQQDKDAPLFFLLSLKAAGTGLNLTRANHVFHYDRWWNPAVENQATDRAFRIGQTKHVQVYKFVSAGTIEEQINEMIEQKQEVADNIVGTGEQWITELSTRDLTKILRLQKGAVQS